MSACSSSGPRLADAPPAAQQHALQFEWAWQHPDKALTTRGLYSAWKRRRLKGTHAQVALLLDILAVDPWRQFPLTVQVLSTEFAPLLAGAPHRYETLVLAPADPAATQARPSSRAGGKALPEHIVVRVAPIEDLPAAVASDDSDGDRDSDCGATGSAAVCSAADMDVIDSLWGGGEASAVRYCR